MEYTKSSLTPLERVELDNLRASSAKNRADIEYIAIMSDVELESDESEGESDEV